MRRWTAPLAALVAFAAWPLAGAGQDATPGPAALPATPDPAECRIAPRPISEVLQLARQALGSEAAEARRPTPTSDRPTPTPSPNPTAPAGHQADPGTIAAANATLWELTACFNAGDRLRWHALHSDRLIKEIVAVQFRRSLARGEPPRQILRSFLRELQLGRDGHFGAAPGDYLAALPLADVRVLPDGRVGAIAPREYDLVPDREDFVVFVWGGERWLLDQGFEVSIGGAATPAP